MFSVGADGKLLRVAVHDLFDGTDTDLGPCLKLKVPLIASKGRRHCHKRSDLHSRRLLLPLHTP